MFAKGTKVRQKVAVIEGEVDARRLDDSSAEGEVEYHVTYTGADGEPAARWFKASELEEEAAK